MIGSILGGRYQILERIGGGGMAIVYRGLDVLLHRPVSIKTLRPEFVGDADFVRRFKREAQAAASLSHPNVVNIYDVGQDQEAHYIVMEYVDGKTLKQIIQERAPLEVDEAVNIAHQICDALAHAHEHKIIHRDVKPHNILISKTGRVKVTDFGIARAISTNTITHHSSSVLGSVHYFSPEQARGSVADEKSDVYSLGVVLYEMLTGRLPFSGESPISIALQHLQEPFVEPRALAPRIPQSVENIVLRALMKDPRERYQSVRQMEDDLDGALLLPDVPKFVSSTRSEEESPTIQIPVIFSQPTAASAVKTPDVELAPQQVEKPLEDERRPWWRRLLVILAWVFGPLVLVGVAAVAAFYIFITFFHVPSVAMPRVVGMTYAEARSKLIAKGFSASKINESFDQNSTSGVQIGQVENQIPAAGPVLVDQDITLVVKAGSAQLVMPSLAGELQSSASAQLIDKGVPSGNITTTQQPSNTVPVNEVISSTPAAGTPFDTTTTPVTLVISSGAQSAAVPDVTGKTLKVATSILTSDGFTVGHVTRSSSFGIPSGQVMTQTPSPGQQAASGSTVDLTVSSGQPTNTVVTKESVDVSLPPNTPLPSNVKIVVVDALGTRTAIDASQTVPAATYSVSVTTVGSNTGEIDVYENGQLVSSQVVPSSASTTSGSNPSGAAPSGGSGTGGSGTGSSGTGSTTGNAPAGGTGTGNSPSGTASAGTVTGGAPQPATPPSGTPQGTGAVGSSGN